MNPQTSGCMRRVRSRKMPMSGGTVALAPSRCSRTDTPAPSGCVPWETWASCSGSPSRMTLRAAVPQLDDDSSACPRLAGAGRTLDEEIALVQRGGAVADLARIGRLDRPGEAAGQSRARARDDVFERAILMAPRQHGGAEAGEGT